MCLVAREGLYVLQYGSQHKHECEDVASGSQRFMGKMANISVSWPNNIFCTFNTLGVNWRKPV